MIIIFYSSQYQTFFSFSNAFPSIGGGGRRIQMTSQSQAKKAKRGRYPVFIPPRETWTRDFCLLSKTTDSKVPTFAEMNQLKEAGLGRKKVTFPDKKAGHNEVCKCLEKIYPKLESQAGAFELLKAERGGKHCPLTVIPMSPKGYTIEHMRDTVSSGTVIYVRPIQGNLPMSKVNCSVDRSLVTQCQHCKRNVPINIIRHHMSSCHPPPMGDGKIPVSAFLAANPPQDIMDVDASVEFDAQGPAVNEPVAGPSNAQFPRYRQKKNSSATCSSADSDDRDSWNSRLSLLFPDLEDEEINNALIGADSVEEAANTIIDSTCPMTKESGPDDGIAKVIGVGKLLPPKDLDSFLNRFKSDKMSEDYEEMAVDRECIWRDAMKHYKRKINDNAGLRKRLEVSFINEDGLDGGAMKTEFFQLVLGEVTKRLFEGDQMNLLLVKDSRKLFLFRMAGMLMVHVILQDGPLYAIPTLAPSVAESILGGSLEDVSKFLSKHHIPINTSTESLHDFIERLNLAKTPEDLKMLLFEDSNKDVYWQLVNSCHWSITTTINMGNKDLLVQELIYNEFVASRRQEISELQAGLETLGFLNYAKQHPLLAKEILCYNNDLRRPFGVEELKSIITSEPKSFEQKQAEMWLYEFLEDEGIDKELIGGSRIKALLMFCTGHTHLPRNGFRAKLQIQFLPDDDEQTLPTASACLHILRLPTVHSSKSQFCKAMDTALKFAALGFPNP